MIENLLDFLKHQQYEESTKTIARNIHKIDTFFVAKCLGRISKEKSESDKTNKTKKIK